MHEATRLLGNTPDVNEDHYTSFVGEEAAKKVNVLADYLFKKAK